MANEQEGAQPKVWWKRNEVMALLITVVIMGGLALGYFLLTRALNQ